MKIKFKKPHVPYKWQKYALDNLSLYNCIVAARQHGKTELLTEIGYSIIHSPHIKNPCWSIASDTKNRVYRLYAKRLNDHFSNNEHFNWTSPEQTSFKIPRKEHGDYITINIHGSTHSFTGMKGETNHYVIIDEAGLVSDRYFEETVAPTVSASRGIVCVTGTVEANHWQDLYYKAQNKMEEGDKRWFSMFVHWGDHYSRQAFTKDDLDSMKSQFDLKSLKDATTWKKEYLCDWSAASVGSPFSFDFNLIHKENRVGRYPYDRRYKVGTCWDNGNYTAIWFWQLIGGRVRMIDYKEYNEVGMKQIAAEVSEWYEKKNAALDKHLFPHTMAERIQEVNMTSKAEIVCGYLGDDIRDCIIIPRIRNIELKIDATKELLRICSFNKGTTSRGLRCIQQYRRKIVKGHVVATIDKNEYSHGAEAIGELALALQAGILGDMNSFYTDYEREGLENTRFFREIGEEEREAFETRKKMFDVLGGY